MNEVIDRCSGCGDPLAAQDSLGVWYWCWNCDAHYLGCSNKGSTDFSQCPSNKRVRPCRSRPEDN